jgi:hypothetical protein
MCISKERKMLATIAVIFSFVVGFGWGILARPAYFYLHDSYKKEKQEQEIDR